VAPQPEWFEKDYYKILGVDESSAPKEITRAYRKLARELHPDANPGDAAAEERFKDVAAAYDVVGDEDRRKEYDEVRRLGPMGGMGGGFGGPGAGAGRPGGGGFQFNTDDIGDLFGNLFTGGGRRSGTGRGAGPQRGSDLETQLTMDFRDAVEGITTTLHLTSDAACTTCGGTGAKPGTAPIVCTNCHGRGVVDENQGMFSFSRPCSVCGGKGSIVVDPCPTCAGTGVTRRPRDVKVRIPAGVRDGQSIKLKGRGGPGRNGGPAGDLYVKVQVAADKMFGRDGSNLTLTVPVTFPEAALGTKLTVPTVEGDSVTVRLPPGTASGKVFRVKGRGIDSGRNGRGDLLVTVQVSVPTKLTKEQKAAVEALAAASTDSPRTHLGV
jgi:molecular chaperone DnaJ